MDASAFVPIAALVGPGADLVAAWLLTYALHSSAILIAAWGITSIPALRWSPSARLLIWRVALVAGVVTATAQVVAPALSHGSALRLTDAARGTVAAIQVLQRTEAPLPAAAGSGTAIRLLVFTISRATLAVAAWGLVAIALIVRLAIARRQLDERLGSRRAATATPAGSALRHLAANAQVTRPVVLSTSDALAAPAAISSGEIVLPSRALHQLTLAEQEGVLAHELAHVVRHDTRWLQLAAWIERLAWFQPLNRVARRQMQCEAEFAADAWAVRLTRQPVTLARALARVAEWVAADASGATPATAGATHGADGSPLVERVRRLTAPPPDMRRASLGGRPAGAAMMVAALLALAFLPHIEGGRAVAGTGVPRVAVVRRDEHIDLRVPGGRASPAPAGGSSTSVRVLMVGNPRLRLDRMPASGAPRRIIVVARQVS